MANPKPPADPLTGRSLDDPRLLPQSLEMEQASIGAALMSATAAKQLVQTLRADDFYTTNHRVILGAIADLVAKDAPVDVLTVPEHLREHDLLEKVGGMAYFAQLADAVPTAAHADFYFEAVRKKAIKRRLMEDARALFAAAEEEEEPEAAVALATARLEARRKETLNGKGLPQPVSLPELFSRKFDPRLALVERMWLQGLTMLHSGPKVGKTKLICNLVVAAGTGGKFLGEFPCRRSGALCLLMEDTELDTQERFMAHLRGCQVPSDIFVEWSWPHLGAGGLELIDSFLAAHPTVKLVIVDTLEYLLPPRDQKADIYAQDVFAVRILKNLADKYDAVVVVLHHSNKSKELQEDIIASAGGTHGKTGSCDCVAQLLPQADETIVFRGKGRRMPPFSHLYRIVDAAEESYELEYIGEAGDVRRSEAERELLEALQHGAMSSAELRNDLGVQAETFRSRTRRAVHRGFVRTVGRGNKTLWELTPEGQAALRAMQGETPETPDRAETPATSATPRPPERDPLYIPPETPETLPKETFRYGGSDASNGAGVSPVAERSTVSGVSPPVFVDDLPLPIGMDPDEKAYRQSVWRLAGALSFPKGNLNGVKISGGEAFYRDWCQDAHPDGLAGLYGMLERLSP